MTDDEILALARDVGVVYPRLPAPIVTRTEDGNFRMEMKVPADRTYLERKVIDFARRLLDRTE